MVAAKKQNAVILSGASPAPLLPTDRAFGSLWAGMRSRRISLRVNTSPSASQREIPWLRCASPRNDRPSRDRDATPTGDTSHKQARRAGFQPRLTDEL